MTEPILVERADGEDEGIVTVVLNRPEKLNAMTRAMWGRLGEVMTELSTDDTVRCLIVRGAGERAFSPGNDISAFETDRSNADISVIPSQRLPRFTHRPSASVSNTVRSPRWRSNRMPGLTKKG